MFYKLVFFISLKLPQRFECEILFQFVTDPGCGLYKKEISKRHLYSTSMCDGYFFGKVLKKLYQVKKRKEVPQKRNTS